jgi:hypothetical protein
VFGLQTQSAATGVQPRQNGCHSCAGYSYANPQSLERMRCSPKLLGESGRDPPQQTDRPRRESSISEDRYVDEGSRETAQQTDGSCRTAAVASHLKPADLAPSGPIAPRREPASDIDTAAADRLKALDPKRPVREAEIA